MNKQVNLIKKIISDFPEEFNIEIYKNKNPHLMNMNLKELNDHFNFYGYNEGLPCNNINNRYDFIKLISQDKNILEIGPLCFPCMDVKRDNVYTIDYFSQEELKENYKNDPNVNINKICKVNYVLKDKVKYNQIIPKIFDVCFSSHNIEHVPCIITFLNNVSSILKDNSYFFLCIPDYRYCFDHLKEQSNIFQVLNSYYNKQDKPSAVNILEDKYYRTHNDSNLHWNKFYNSIRNIFVSINEKEHFIKNKKNDIIKDIESIKEMYELSKNTYIDSHCWKFSPVSFKNIIEILYETGFIDLKINRLYRTLKGSNEFYVILEKN